MSGQRLASRNVSGEGMIGTGWTQGLDGPVCAKLSGWDRGESVVFLAARFQNAGLETGAGAV